jgi:hypothetical protein
VLFRSLLQGWSNQHQSPAVSLANDKWSVANLLDLLQGDPVPADVSHVPGIPTQAADANHAYTCNCLCYKSQVVVLALETILLLGVQGILGTRTDIGRGY